MRPQRDTPAQVEGQVAFRRMVAQPLRRGGFSHRNLDERGALSCPHYPRRLRCRVQPRERGALVF
jgi:hypothetical protein